jgi:hypothetical protein
MTKTKQKLEGGAILKKRIACHLVLPPNPYGMKYPEFKQKSAVF